MLYSEFIPDTVYQVIKANDTFNLGDIIWLDSRDGAIFNCTLGGWLDKEDVVSEVKTIDCIIDDSLIIIGGRVVEKSKIGGENKMDKIFDKYRLKSDVDNKKMLYLCKV